LLREVASIKAKQSIHRYTGTTANLATSDQNTKKTAMGDKKNPGYGNNCYPATIHKSLGAHQNIANSAISKILPL